LNQAELLTIDTEIDRDGMSDQGGPNGHAPANGVPSPLAPDANPRPPVKPVLAPDQSAVLRDRLVAHRRGGRLGHRSLPAKNTLTAADAELVEAGFPGKGSHSVMGGQLTGCGRPSKAGPGASWVFPNSHAEKPPAAATAVPAHVAAAGSGQDADNPQKAPGELITPGSAVGSGIDKSVLAISEPRRYRDKAHRKFVSEQACLVCGRPPSDPHHLRSAQPRALSPRSK